MEKDIELIRIVVELRAELGMCRIPFNLHKPLLDALQLLDEVCENAERIQ